MNPLILILLIVLLVFGAVVYTNMTAEAQAVLIAARANAQATTMAAQAPIIIASIIGLAILPASIGAMVHLMRRREPEKIVQREILILPEGSTRRDVWNMLTQNVDHDKSIQ